MSQNLFDRIDQLDRAIMKLYNHLVDLEEATPSYLETKQLLAKAIQLEDDLYQHLDPRSKEYQQFQHRVKTRIKQCPKNSAELLRMTRKEDRLAKKTSYLYQPLFDIAKQNHEYRQEELGKIIQIDLFKELIKADFFKLQSLFYEEKISRAKNKEKAILRTYYYMYAYLRTLMESYFIYDTSNQEKEELTSIQLLNTQSKKKNNILEQELFTFLYQGIENTLIGIKRQPSQLNIMTPADEIALKAIIFLVPEENIDPFRKEVENLLQSKTYSLSQAKSSILMKKIDQFFEERKEKQKTKLKEL